MSSQVFIMKLKRLKVIIFYILELRCLRNMIDNHRIILLHCVKVILISQNNLDKEHLYEHNGPYSEMATT